MERKMDNIPVIHNTDPVSGSLTVFLDGKQYKIFVSEPNFQSALTAYASKDWESLRNIVNPAEAFKKLYAKYEQIEVKDGNVFVSGEPISTLVANRILDYLSMGLDCVPVFKFITKLNLNPSKRAVDELYTFLEHKYLPVTENGNFLAYKALRSDYTDVYTGKNDNRVGNIVEMPRNKVDDNKEVGCSQGLHAGALDYARKYRPADGKLVVVEINPADVVSIPIDCEFQKLRTCKYKVHSEYEVPLEDLLYESRFTTDNDEDVDREWDDKDTFECPDCGTQHIMSYCNRCEYCSDCCECIDEDDEDEEYDPSDSGGCMGDPDAPKIEVQLELNLDNKMTTNWADERFQYLVMLPWLYAHQRPAIANALRRFYADVDDQNKINPIFAILRQFTSDEDAYKIYKEFTNS
jgi:hypothetical protein